MAEARERLEGVARKWFISEPALFAVYCKHDLTSNYKMACAIRSGQGKVEFHPDIINTLSDPELEQRMRAEMIRLCLRHPYERQPVGCSQRALHLGSDLVISPAYELGLIGLSHPKEFNLPEGQHFEWYVDNLSEMQQQAMKEIGESEDSEEEQSEGQEGESGKKDNGKESEQSDGSDDSEDGDSQNKDQEGSKPGNSSKKEGQEGGASKNGAAESDAQSGNDQKGEQQGSQGKQDQSTDGEQESGQGQSSQDGGEDDGQGSGSEDGLDPATAKLLGQGDEYSGLWREDEERMVQLKETLEGITDWGSIPSQMVETIQRALEGRIDYRKVLRAFQTSIISTNRNLTRMRPNRRFGFDAMGSKHDMSSKLLVAVDVSGSVSNKALGKFFRIISNFFKYGVEQVDVIQFDAAVSKDVTTLKQGSSAIKKQNIEVFGRGGTNFQCVINYLKDHNSYDGLIIFTDGYAPAPHIKFPTRAKLLWVTETKEQYDISKGWMKKLGRACFIM